MTEVRLKSGVVSVIGVFLLLLAACSDVENRPERKVVIPDFDFPQTIAFEDSLSAYGIYEGTWSKLQPSAEYHLLELSSVLFTDYAHKQRLVKVPTGKRVSQSSDGSLRYPDGTILVKTFFYYNDERDTSLGKQIIETRILIKEAGIWNIAPYRWNEAQTNAELALNGEDLDIQWQDESGRTLTTRYHVPNENECITCHQSNSIVAPIGPTPRNLNREVNRNGLNINQLRHLQDAQILENINQNQVANIANYDNPGASLNDRGRAYLDMNCAHCHNPNGWNEPAKLDFDFRLETPVDQTGILYGRDKIKEAITTGEMPFIGTTLPDHRGIDLVLEYLESL